MLKKAIPDNSTELVVYIEGEPVTGRVEDLRVWCFRTT